MERLPKISDTIHVTLQTPKPALQFNLPGTQAARQHDYFVTIPIMYTGFFFFFFLCFHSLHVFLNDAQVIV